MIEQQPDLEPLQAPPMLELPLQPKQTLASLIDSIDFNKKSKTKSSYSHSDVDSISSGHSVQLKEKSKVWAHDEIQLFHILLKKYGTDFHILSSFFPRKTKSQLKNRYKQYINVQRKKDKEESNKLKAVSLLFQEVQEGEEKDEDEKDFKMTKRQKRQKKQQQGEVQMAFKQERAEMQMENKWQIKVQQEREPQKIEQNHLQKMRQQ